MSEDEHEQKPNPRPVTLAEILAAAEQKKRDGVEPAEVDLSKPFRTLNADISKAISGPGDSMRVHFAEQQRLVDEQRSLIEEASESAHRAHQDKAEQEHAWRETQANLAQESIDTQKDIVRQLDDGKHVANRTLIVAIATLGVALVTLGVAIIWR